MKSQGFFCQNKSVWRPIHLVSINPDCWGFPLQKPSKNAEHPSLFYWCWSRTPKGSFGGFAFLLPLSTAEAMKIKGFALSQQEEYLCLTSSNNQIFVLNLSNADFSKVAYCNLNAEWMPKSWWLCALFWAVANVMIPLIQSGEFH